MLWLLLSVRCAVQHEVGKRNLEILNATTDARGRKLEVVKVHCPPPLFRTYKEAEGVHVSLLASNNICFYACRQKADECRACWLMLAVSATG